MIKKYLRKKEIKIGNYKRVALISLGLLSFMGCSHTHPFNPNWPVGTIKTHPLSGKTIMLDLSGVKETYQDKLRGYSHNMTRVRASADTMIRKMFASDRLVDDPAKADYVLKLTLSLKLESPNYFTCAAATRWEIFNKGTLASVGTSTFTKGVSFMKLQGLNCEEMFLNAYPVALDSAFNNLNKLSVN